MKKRISIVLLLLCLTVLTITGCKDLKDPISFSAASIDQGNKDVSTEQPENETSNVEQTDPPTQPSHVNEEKGEPSNTQKNEIPPVESDTVISEDELYSGSNLSGRVVTFTESGCTITPQITEDDGSGYMIAYEAAPGYEKEEDNVSITYQDGCIFQIAVSNPNTGESVLSHASLSDIKNQVSLILFGTFVDNQHYNATKVIIQIINN